MAFFGLFGSKKDKPEEQQTQESVTPVQEPAVPMVEPNIPTKEQPTVGQAPAEPVMPEPTQTVQTEPTTQTEEEKAA